MLKGINDYSFLNFLFIQSFPSITLETSIEDDVSPTTFNKVAAGSIIVATIVKIGSAVSGNPIIVIISVSDIVPPPTGIAVTKSVEISATNITFPVLTSALNRYTKNIILNTLPITEPSLWKLVPSGIIVSAISSDTPIFFALVIFTGIDAADEHVDTDATVGGNIFFQNNLKPFLPPEINAYKLYITK